MKKTRKWEYTIVEYYEVDWEKIGLAGWELATSYVNGAGTFFVFKRELEEDEPFSISLRGKP